jgi:hypothetical protein
LQITSAAGFVSSGPAGGPFNPVGETLILTNAGAGSLSWVLGGGASWLSASPGAGVLTSGGPGATVAMSVNSSASSLAAGSYPATVWFTNLNDHTVQCRRWTLDVVTQPLIIRQPGNQSVPLGGTAVFSVDMAENALMFFQWQDNSTNLTDGERILGSASSTLTINNVTTADAGTYKVTISNAAGTVTSIGSILTIASSAPVIVSQPGNQSAAQGDTAMFTVAADRWRQYLRFQYGCLDAGESFARQCRNIFGHCE